jgi:large subunit ribosomal protein L22
MQITAKLSDYRQSPRKVRLVARLIKGKKIEDAKNTLAFLIKRASKPLSDLLNSAVANAVNNFNIPSENLYVKEFRVDEGVVLKRRMPRARGSAFPINKRTSHIFIQLDTIDNMPKKKGKIKKAEVKDIKKETKKVEKKAEKTEKNK